MYLRDFLPLNPSTTTVYARSAFYPRSAYLFAFVLQLLYVFWLVFEDVDITIYVVICCFGTDPFYPGVTSTPSKSRDVPMQKTPVVLQNSRYFDYIIHQSLVYM